MKGNIIRMKLQTTISDRTMDQIVQVALEGGIEHWCEKAEIIGNYLGERDSDQISRGGQIFLYDFIGEQELYLNKRNFLEGVKLFILNSKKRKETTDYGVRFYDIDSNHADFIIQYALFGEVKYI